MSDHDDQGQLASEISDAEPAAQEQLADHELCPNEPGRSVLQRKLEANPCNGTKGGVEPNLEHTDSKPTLKQRRFAIAYANPDGANGNGTLACRLAGYKGNENQLAVQASANVRNPKIQQLIAGMLDSMTERALQRLGAALDATTSRAFLGGDGTIVYTEAVPDHRTRLHAVKFLFDLRGKCGAVEASDGREVDHVHGDEVGGEQIDSNDRALFEQAAAIEDELAEVDSLNEGRDHEHDD